VHTIPPIYLCQLRCHENVEVSYLHEVYRTINIITNKNSPDHRPNPIPIEERQTFFASMFSTARKPLLNSFTDQLPGVTNCEIANKNRLSINENCPTLDEVICAISRVKSGRAQGPDNMTIEMIRAGGEPVANAIHCIIQHFWKPENYLRNGANLSSLAYTKEGVNLKNNSGHTDRLF
jgi:hypothetical protein